MKMGNGPAHSRLIIYVGNHCDPICLASAPLLVTLTGVESRWCLRLPPKDRLIDKCDPLAKFLYPCFTPFSPVRSLTKLIMSVPAQIGIQYMPILLGQRILIVPLIVGPLTIGIG
jgi:hypothetical protein